MSIHNDACHPGHNKPTNSLPENRMEDARSALIELNTVGSAQADEPRSESSSTNSDQYPEGGWAAWSVVLGSFLSLLATSSFLNNLGVYQAYLAHNQLKEYPESDIGWIPGLFAFLVFFCGVMVGPIFDAKGPRVLVAAGSVLVSLFMLLLGFCTEYWHFMLVIGFVGGLGTSMVYTVAVSVVQHWFLRRRGLATGTALTAGALAGVIFPLILQPLFDSVGFAWATRIIAFIIIGLLLVANLLIRSRLRPRSSGSILPDPGIFRDKAFTITTIGTFFQEWGLFIPLTYLTSYGLHSGAMSSAFAYQLVSIFNGSSLVGRVLPGLISDRLGRYNTTILTIIFSVVAPLGIWVPATVMTANRASALRSEEADATVRNLTIAFTVLMGFGSGSNLSLTPVCIGQLCETKQYGQYFATCYTVVSFSTLTSIPIGGALLSACGGEYWGTALFTGLCYLLSLAAFTTVRVMKVGWKLSAVY
ncbi:Riboflavin transporter MCH5 [Elsinoe australis]|uniref:Riboflavin transporter MCH5 n=1 Tax=Elsinoe australis TaxID=40998 RepID=A0A2P8ADU2_9PEZI|nr:Riboflavin transporter MCH5 [Elsinoe australis]